VYNVLWIGVLIGVPVGAFAPGWVKPIVFAAAVVLSDLARTTSRNVRNVHNINNVHFIWPPWLIGLIGLILALWSWHYARMRGLQHLGRAELRARWNTIRGVSRWGW
jgi:hypothetical protein